MSDMSENSLLQAMYDIRATHSSAIKPSGKCYMTIPSRSLAFLVMIEAKARWKAEYRRQRMEAKGLTDPVRISRFV